MQPHDTRKAVQIGHPDRVMAKGVGGQDQLIRRARAAQEREGGGDAQLDKARRRVGGEIAR